MANKQALDLLRKGQVDEFNKWAKMRRKETTKGVDLKDQDLSDLKLHFVDLRDANLVRVLDEAADYRDARFDGAARTKAGEAA